MGKKVEKNKNSFTTKLTKEHEVYVIYYFFRVYPMR